MNDEEKARQAWRLWHLIRMVSDALWDYHEKEFLEFCEQSHSENQYIGKSCPKTDEEIPF
jgi:hypothetical protein